MQGIKHASLQLQSPKSTAMWVEYITEESSQGTFPTAYGAPTHTSTQGGKVTMVGGNDFQ